MIHSPFHSCCYFSNILFHLVFSLICCKRTISGTAPHPSCEWYGWLGQGAQCSFLCKDTCGKTAQATWLFPDSRVSQCLEKKYMNSAGITPSVCQRNSQQKFSEGFTPLFLMPFLLKSYHYTLSSLCPSKRYSYQVFLFSQNGWYMTTMR